MNILFGFGSIFRFHMRQKSYDEDEDEVDDDVTRGGILLFV